MGTPDFAVAPLLALHAAAFKVILVVTQPDRPKGRGRIPAPPPVKEAALRLGYTVAQPVKVRDPAFVARLNELEPDFIVVVAFGQILPLHVLQIPKFGAVNIHASLLPRYRGPAPIQWAVIRGEHQTGITTMLMDSGVDTGDILLQSSTPIRADETAGQLHDRLSHLGAQLLVSTLIKLIEGSVAPQPQNHAQASYAPLLKKTDGHIHWHQPAGRLDAFVRAMTPWPGAFCHWRGRLLKILKAHPLEGVDTQAAPGTVIESFPDELRVAAQPGALAIDELQGESGKRLSAKDFLRGHDLAPGTLLT
ncbi:MAG: methionyl-tRNA formyltransferase [Desulfobacteraceae bacterium]|nr:MAG: methionyl-tRNA formyltransferase [Desulfobacteraceae bacterium]